jgi:hypothetical protein
MVPCLQVPDPEALRLTCGVDGEVVQNGVAADMVFALPPRYLRAGAHVEAEVELVSTVSKPVRGYDPSETS